MSLQDWKDAVKNDASLQKLIPLICNGWPREARLPECLRSFSKVKDELCWEDGLVLRGNLLIPPNKLKEKLMALAHEGHSGCTATKKDFACFTGGQGWTLR